ncbi:MAG: twin-arginine translocase subunit TatC [Fibrobacteres bacterium]|nr:twin-arginine translocase subunit TatC [Fibrobacterota bacterium]
MMPFLAHLDELRIRLIRSAIALVITTIAAYYFWQPILKIFTVYPLHRLQIKPPLVYTGAAEAFMVSFKIAFFGGIILGAPFILFQIWRFIAPGLYINERKMFLPVLFFSLLFFLGGMSFCYFLVLPLAFAFLLDFYGVGLTPMLTIGDYIGFNVKMLLAFGLVFEMPVFAFVLARLKILTHTFLIRQFRYAVVIIFVIAAILTPPDVISQSLMAAPLLVLYGISIGVAYFARRKDD